MTTPPAPHDPQRIIIFDTTLRDGEQSPGAAMSLDEKVRIALMLEELGVDVMEAGFPIASRGDFEAVNAIAQTIKNVTVCGLARAEKNDIERTADAIRPAPRQRIHTFISTSPLHMKHKLNMEPEKVLERVAESVAYARNLCGDVEWSAEDGSRTEHDFLCRCVEAAIKAGATTINVPDTVGYSTPQEYEALFRMLVNRVPNIGKAILSAHCHNDLGLATANSLAAALGGARQVECTINGLGERAGNAALEEIVMALRVRRDTLPFTTNIVSEKITRASQLVSTITGFNVQPNKAIVGANAFAHESGIHQDGMIKNRETYEIMTPQSVGLTKTSLKLGKLSGRNAFRSKLQELGYELGDDALTDAFKRFKDIADRKKEVFDEDLLALVDDQIARANDQFRFVGLEVHAGSRTPPSATLELSIDGRNVTATATGNGPIDAAFNALKSLIPHKAELVLYQVKAITGGTDAQAETTVRLEEDGYTVNGQGTDPDTIVSSARAYIHALNKLAIRRLKSAPTHRISPDSL
ncbi:MAG: 2-isopropylmalate synthase [Alphaproteobacteria bacterium]|nr:2-isopropylmalate synthase [Alphaproteobacteria bacterium]